MGDKDAAYRGRRRLEVESPPKVVVHDSTGALATEVDVETGLGCNRTWRRRATKSEKEASKSWKQRREDYGYAPWVLIRGQIRGMEASVESEDDRTRLEFSTHPNAENADWFDDSNISAPSKTLRDWADEYCASHRLLKEFTYEKVVYGWNMTALRQAIENAIRSNYVHPDKVDVAFNLGSSTISVRPNNRFSRMLSNKWMMILLCITLIYPLFIWPFKKFGRRGGGEWRVAGSAFALTKWVHLEDSIPGETVEEYRQRTPSTSKLSHTDKPKLLKATPKGISELIGTREGEWFAEWEDTIASFVKQRHISPVPVTQPLGGFKTAGIGLDGYYPDAQGQSSSLISL